MNRSYETSHLRAHFQTEVVLDNGVDNTDDSAQRGKVVSVARQQFDELNETNTGTLCEEEVQAMVEQLLPANTSTGGHHGPFQLSSRRRCSCSRIEVWL